MRSLQHFFLSCKNKGLAGTAVRLIFLGMIMGCFSLTPAQAALHRYKISGVMPGYGDVAETPAPQISPDGRYVVYVADQQADDAYELYTAPIDGSSAPVRISPPLSTTVYILDFSISPDSSRVVYRADQDTDEVFELYAVYDDSYRKSFLLFMPAILSGSINKE
jgi:hypothetical protein